MMILQKWISAIRYRIRAFLGINELSKRAETIALRDDMAKNHREVVELLLRLRENPRLKANSLPISQFAAPSMTWEYVQSLELQQMLENPPKED